MPVNPTPDVPFSSLVATIASNSIKAATPEIILDNSDISVEALADLIFENIGSQELINIARHDTVNGAEVLYQPIKNLSRLSFEYGPQNMISIQNTSSDIFKNFSIKLDAHTPEPGSGSGPNGETVYIDQESGNLIIDIINIFRDEQVEIQILNDGEVLDDTIY